MFYGGQVTVEMLESVATGSRSRLFRLRLAAGPRQAA
jgi:hypothetical protein